MPRYTIDGTLTFASQIDAETEDAAMLALRDTLQAFEPNLVLPVEPGQQVTSAVITEISLGTLRDGEPQADMWLADSDEVEGD